ncbi:membrane protein [Lentzea fradiae]|uniref:Membrane protein n=1 Tax=Lentzea fradiae TaxID=200378 RepID=A0A1G7TDQ0_9PSEU|nr:MmpS family transport accessory protein [Lentzea fradiae]SDG33321.1 membrane protein [Lentzea fradiae]
MSYPQSPHDPGQQFQQQMPPGQVPQYAPQYMPQPPKKKARKWPWVLGIIAVLIVAMAINSSRNDSDENSTAGNATGDAQQTAPAAAQPAAKKTVVYEVTGAGQAMSITYTTDGMTSTQQEGDVQLPWSKTIELPTGEALQMVSMIVQAGQGTTEIAGKITVDGTVVKEGKSSGQYAMLSINENIGTLGR